VAVQQEACVSQRGDGEARNEWGRVGGLPDCKGWGFAARLLCRRGAALLAASREDAIAIAAPSRTRACLSRALLLSDFTSPPF
jgi:hypothetical protein